MALFDTRLLGRGYDAPPFDVTAERIRAYGAATDDPSPAVERGVVAPAVFAVVPRRPAIRALFKDLTPLYERLKGLHGEEDIVVHTPLEAGMVVRPRATLFGVRKRRTGTAAIARSELLTEDGTLVGEQYITLYFPGAEAEEVVGADAPAHALPDEVHARPPDAQLSQPTALDQPARYARASGDTGRYHLDDRFARSVGLPGVILHGMCTMAFAARAVVALVGGDDPASLTRVAVRFTRPVRPGDTLTTSVWRLGENGAYGFETHDGSGNVVLGAGRAHVRDGRGA